MVIHPAPEATTPFPESAGETEIRISLRVRRRTLLACCASLVLHLLVLFVMPPPLPVDMNPPSSQAGLPLAVKLRSQKVESTAKLSVPKPQPAQTPAQKRVRSERRAPLTPPPILAQRDPQTINVPPPSVTASAEQAHDMMSYVNAARARRQAAQTEQISAAPPGESGMSGQDGTEDAVRMARAMRNLKSGTNGIFQILSMESRRAAFSFRGWTTDSLNARREYLAVEIGSNKTIEIAIVRKMIELIRRYYSGNFNWQSQRLDQQVVLSARPEDNDGLEEFMLREFFGGTALSVAGLR